MNSRATGVACGVLILLVGCEARRSVPKPPDASLHTVVQAEPTPARESIAGASNRLGFRLLSQLPKTENALLSPFAFTRALVAQALIRGPNTAEGLAARLASGRTAEELTQGTDALHAAFLRHGAATSNRLRWDEDPSLNPASAAVELSFEGHWHQRFERDRTRAADFHEAATAATQIPYMHQTARLPYVEIDGVSVLELPYQREGFSMLIWLPRRELSLAELVARVAESGGELGLESIKPRVIQLAMPKFRLRSETELASAARTSSVAGDFHGVQRVELVVDEDGDEGEAGAGKVVGARTIGPPPLVLRVDRPFVFAVRDRPSGSILFLGFIVSPGLGAGEVQTPPR